jgi:hypothetical protein
MILCKAFYFIVYKLRSKSGFRVGQIKKCFAIHRTLSKFGGKKLR